MNKNKPTCFQKKYGSTTNLLYWKTPWLIWMMKSSALAFLAKSLMSMSLTSSSPEISRNCGQKPSNHMGQEKHGKQLECLWDVHEHHSGDLATWNRTEWAPEKAVEPKNGMSSNYFWWTMSVFVFFEFSSIMNIIHVKSCYGILDVKRTCHPSSMIFIDYGWISGWLPAGSDVVE